MKWLLAAVAGGGGVMLMEDDELRNALVDTLPAVKDLADQASGLASLGMPPNTMLWIIIVIVIGRPAMTILDKWVTDYLTRRAQREARD